MTEALHLFEIDETPRLTDRQTHAYQQIQQAGYDGLHTDEIGAAAHAFAGKHSAGDRCQFCGSAGLELGRALRAKGLVQQRRRRHPGGVQVTVWTVAGRLEAVADLPAGMTTEIPY